MVSGYLTIPYMPWKLSDQTSTAHTYTLVQRQKCQDRLRKKQMTQEAAEKKKKSLKRRRMLQIQSYNQDNNNSINQQQCSEIRNPIKIFHPQNSVKGSLARCPNWISPPSSWSSLCKNQNRHSDRQSSTWRGRVPCKLCFHVDGIPPVKMLILCLQHGADVSSQQIIITIIIIK